MIAEIDAAGAEAARRRSTFSLRENEPQDARSCGRSSRAAMALDASGTTTFTTARWWRDGAERGLLHRLPGTPQEFSPLQVGLSLPGPALQVAEAAARHAALGLAAGHVRHFLQNHDQVANPLRARVLHKLTSPGRYRAMTALLLLGPGTPMLFQGQEFAATHAVFLFRRITNRNSQDRCEKAAPSSCAISFDCNARDGRAAGRPWRTRNLRALQTRFLRARAARARIRASSDLLRLRRENSVFNEGRVDGAVLAAETFVLRHLAHDAPTGCASRISVDDLLWKSQPSRC